VVGNDDQSNDLPPPPWETQNAESDPFQAGLAGGLSVPSGQLGVSRPQSVQITQPEHQISQSLRVDESWGRMGWLYCSTGGTIYRGEDPP
jgi:hypothetical protein